MRNRFAHLSSVLSYLGVLFLVFGLLILLPLLVLAIYARGGREEVSCLCFIVPAAIAFVLGALLKRGRGFPVLGSRGAMLLCALGWIGVSAIGAIPFWLGLRATYGVSYLDAYFETVSGFTTTGITMFLGLDGMPKSILFWRAFIQWLGGLGILTFFLAVVFTGGSAHTLFGAESHKISSKRPVPGLFHTLQILWAIYAAFTLLSAILLMVLGVSVYDAVTHAFTALSTGGYSPYDASIDHYRQAGHRHFAGIEYALIFAMLLGGINFFVHYRVLTGGIRALWDNFEMKLWWLLLWSATLLVVLDHGLRFGFHDFATLFRCSLFQVVSLATTTGFGTKDIGTAYFPALAKQVFLVLMIIGGCVGSTGGGLKALRIGVLLKMASRQVRRIVYGPSAVIPVVVDGEVVDPEEVRRISALFFAWMALLVFGGAVTALFSDFGALESASGMFSALGNIGPCYIPVDAMTRLDPVVKIVYILGMLAGRLEILPILLLFTRSAWR